MREAANVSDIATLVSVLELDQREVSVPHPIRKHAAVVCVKGADDAESQAILKPNGAGAVCARAIPALPLPTALFRRQLPDHSGAGTAVIDRGGRTAKALPTLTVKMLGSPEAPAGAAIQDSEATADPIAIHALSCMSAKHKPSHSDAATRLGLSRGCRGCTWTLESSLAFERAGIALTPRATPSRGAVSMPCARPSLKACCSAARKRSCSVGISAMLTASRMVGAFGLEELSSGAWKRTGSITDPGSMLIWHSTCRRVLRRGLMTVV